ncbi:MAG: hypothetical protein HGA63_05360 [Syntrophobacteraceae bacterium]|nr:hypothetical protein [Syntrophobacteraceae bacterium]
MEMLNAIYEGLAKFLSDYDAHKMAEAIRTLDWGKLLSDPTFWFIFLPPLLLLIWRKAYRFLLLAASLVIFVFLLQYTLPPAGQSMPLNKLLEFIGGSVVLVVVNLYFLFMRE